MQRSYPRFRRRHFFTDKALQSRFILGFSLAVFFGIFINLLAVYFLIDRELAAELYKIHLKVRTTSEIALPILWKLGVVTIPLILIVAAVIGHFLTRRVEEPLLPFLEALKRIGEGDLTGRLDPLGSSRLQDVFGVFNNTVDAVGKWFGSVRGSAAGLEQSLGELEALASRTEGVAGPEFVRAIDDLSARSAEAWEEVSRFKI